MINKNSNKLSLITLHNDIEQHYLQHEFASKATLIEEPVGWKTSNKKLSRSKTTGEFLEKNAKDLEFIGKGREYLKTADAVYGSNCKVRYTIVKQNPKNATDFFKDVYFVDLESYKDKDGKYKVKVDEGGLAKIIKSKQNEKLEIDRNTSLDGQHISNIKKRELQLSGRNIFLETKLNAIENKTVILGGWSRNRNSSRGYYPFPLEPKPNNHTDFVGTINVNPTNSTTEQYHIPKKSDCFFADNDKEKELIINLKGAFDIVLKRVAYKASIWVDLIFEIYDTNGNIKKTHHIQQNIPLSWNVRSVYFDTGYKEKLQQGDRLCFYISSKIKDRAVWRRGLRYVELSNFKGGITLTEHSENIATKTNCLYAKDFIERQLEIITGKKKLLKSEELTTGKASDTVILPLLWARGFTKFKEKKKPAISLKDTVDSICNVWGLSTMVEKIGFKEYLRIEKIDFFYNPNVTIKLPYVVKDVEINYAKDFLNTTYEVGYQKGGSDYEEATGIGEYNGKIEFTTIRNGKEKKLSKLSKIRADSSSIEFARRKHFNTHPQEDTRYDSDWVMIDTIKGHTDVLLERKWQDDFNISPQGIYSPETATNLRLTPKQMLMRRAFFITGNLYHYPTSKLTFTNSNCNSNLEQVRKDGKRIKENKNTIIKSLGRAKFKPYLWKFKHQIDYNLQKKIREKTIINDKQIYNYYGLVEFKISENQYKYGYLFEIDENKGEITILEANI